MIQIILIILKALTAFFFLLAILVIMVSSYLWETHEKKIYDDAIRQSGQVHPGIIEG